MRFATDDRTRAKALVYILQLYEDADLDAEEIREVNFYVREGARKLT